jgi:hypothetical protein
MKNHDMDEQEFLNDIGYIIELTKIIDSMFSKSNRKTYQYLKRLRKIVDRFNHKYSQIMAAIDKTSLAIKLKLFIKKSSVNELMSEIESEKQLKGKIFGSSAKANINYSSAKKNRMSQQVEGTLALKTCKFRGIVEVIYSNEAILNINSPEFQLLYHHGIINCIDDMEIKEKTDNVFQYDFNKIGGEVYTHRRFNNRLAY